MRSPLSNRRRAASLACRLSLTLACATGASLLPATAALADAASVTAATASPLAPGNYETRDVCAVPEPGRASCMASLLVARSTAARAHLHPLGLAATSQPQAPSPTAGDFGLRPQDLHAAYSLPTTAVSAQTVAIVDAYNDPAAEADLAAYDEEFSLPACTAENGCFKQVNEHGESSNLPFPKTVTELETARGGTTTQVEEAEEASGWGMEISLDIETAHAVCQSCHILLVEATAPVNAYLEAAERSAESLGATEISNSWGGSEAGTSTKSEASGPFDHPGTVITASAGDNGYLDWDSGGGSVEFPAASPHVVAVGGTRLKLGPGSIWAGETVWNGDGAGGGGCSTVFPAPSWQQSLADWSSVGCSGARAVADVSADADPYTGVAVSDSTSPECETSYTEGKTKHVLHWCTLGGTSLASPLIASVFALAGGAGGVSYPASTVYANVAATPTDLHDVTSGSNGACGQPFNGSTGVSGCTVEEEAADCASHLICLAAAGYDGPTGLGTPDGITAFEAAGTGGGGEPPTEEEEEEEGSESPGGAPPRGGGAPGGGGSLPIWNKTPADAGTRTPGEGEAEKDKSGQATTAAAGTISGLSLTAATAAAAAHHRLDQLVFSFTASAAVRVRVVLSRQLSTHRRVRWRTTHHHETVTARDGHNSVRLATGRLAPGTYRLTLTTAAGAVSSLVIHVRG
ncbi:MAG TPA: S53 family peptidase [Solirubrobacteraceae bacterium]|nr:S53 family peptidase [Solirubrobacteraceae bacterium]